MMKIQIYHLIFLMILTFFQVFICRRIRLCYSTLTIVLGRLSLLQFSGKKNQFSLVNNKFRDIKYTEYKRLKQDDDFFEFKSLEETEEGFIDYYNDHYLQPERNYRLLEVQTWVFNRNGTGEGIYKVKFYHTDKDEFRAKVYPKSWKDYFR